MSQKKSCVLLFLLLGTGVFNVLDYFLTNSVIGLGHRELNPLIDTTIGTIYFPLIKLTVVPLLLAFLWLVRDKFGKPMMVGVWVMFLTYLSLMVYFKVVFFS